MDLSQDFAQKYGHWALISGGAQGIGAGYAQRLAALGMPLILLDINGDILEQTAVKLRADYPAVEVRTIAVDLAYAPRRSGQKGQCQTQRRRHHRRSDGPEAVAGAAQEMGDRAVRAMYDR